jgi:4-hydroxybenzoate polyprenyltransferase
MASPSVATAIIQAMRPKQWVKNLILFAPLIFSFNIRDTEKIMEAAAAFGVFCLLSSAVYLFNDVADRKNDRQHPIKKTRPIASGALSVVTALVVSGVLLVVAFTGAALLNHAFLIAASIYLVNNLLYTFRIKHVVLVDVGSIALGFVVRVIAGTMVIGVEASEWLIMCTILLAFFLGFAKRRHELVLLGEANSNHRQVLGDYSRELLDQLIMISAACALVSYAIYTVSEKAVTSFGTTNMIYTVPFVLYGLFRYLYLIHLKDRGGDPTKVLLTDGPLIFNVVLWLAACIGIIEGAKS